ncbi:MAG TPA: asparagine synthase (glutamine-hydrolyzing) [Candidatus Methylomirabilis sp.]|nr:asparagine synthase (glutamine-hydrolyzing) [Candidatus Methylomirabilis sp.]
MCGIAGYAGNCRPEALRRMTVALKRRGPDDEGFYESDGVGFGFRRLSIIDVKGGHQPLSNERGDIWVMLNGEIYGYQTLHDDLVRLGHTFKTHGDTETVVHAYEEWGDACFEKLNGMFAIVLWDGPRKRLVLARDRMGKKPLYYIVKDGTLWFASEPKALLAAGVLAREIDPVSLALYFRTDAVPTPRGIFKGMKKLEPATAISWRDGDVEKTWTFWKPPAGPVEGMTERDALSSLREAIDVSVRERLVSDVPLGIFLSGGLDSAVIAESAARQSSSALKAFTIGFDDASHDERDAAAVVAKTFGFVHRVDVLTSASALAMLDEAVACLDEPLADAAVLPQMLLSRFARKEVTVAVAGDGGDELLLGYQHVPIHAFAQSHPHLWNVYAKACPERSRGGNRVAGLVPAGSGYFSAGFKLQRLVRGMGETDPWKRDTAWRGAWTSADLSSLLRPDVRDAARVALADELLAARAHELTGDRSFWQRWSWAYMRTFLMDDVMVKVDRATMWMSLEARAPLLDRRVVESVFRIPDRYKIGAWKKKRLFVELLRGKLPEDILKRPKHGFGVPVAAWLNGPLAGRLRELSDSSFLKEQGLFEPSVIVKMIDEHSRGRPDRRKELWSFFMFQLWYRAWLKR